MFSGVYQSIALLGIISIFYLIDFMFIRHYDSRRQDSRTGRAWDFTLMAFVFVIVLVLQPVFLPWLGITTNAPWEQVLQAAGVLLAISALALHVWARMHLQQFYAERVEVQAGHRIVTTGPYARIRHPVITSFFGLVIAMFMIDPAVTTLLLMLYTYFNFSQAAKDEEKLLSQHFPEYVSYNSVIYCIIVLRQ